MIPKIMRLSDEFRRSLGCTTINGFERDAVRRDIYDIAFLKEPEDPYSTVRMSSKERYASTHLYYSRVSEFMLYEVGDKLKCSFAEFLEYPTWFVEFILSTLRQQSKDSRQQGAKVEKQLTQAQAELAQFTNMKNR